MTSGRMAALLGQSATGASDTFSRPEIEAEVFLPAQHSDKTVFFPFVLQISLLLINRQQ
jgi:hypothetical protein